MVIKRLLAAIVIVFAIPSTALAQQNGRGLYLYGAVGASRSNRDSNRLDSNLANAGATGISSSVDGSDTGYKLQLGYMFNRNWGIEGGWVDLGRARYNANFTGGTTNAEIRTSGFNLNGIYAWPVAERVSLFAKAGALYADNKTSASGSGPGATSVFGTNGWRWGVNLGIGAMYEFTSNFALRGEIERYDLGDANTTGRGHTALLSAGLKYSFR